MVVIDVEGLLRVTAHKRFDSRAWRTHIETCNYEKYGVTITLVMPDTFASLGLIVSSHILKVERVYGNPLLW